RDLVPRPAVRRKGGPRHGARQHRRAARRPRGRDGEVVPRDPPALADGAPLPQGGLQRRLRRPGRPAGARRQRDAPLLHDRGGPRGEGGLPAEAQAAVQQVQEAPVTPKAWLVACRPATLVVGVAPVLVAPASAAPLGRVAALPFAAALLGAVFLQIGSNLANDVFDHEKGADGADRLGPTRAVASGLLTGAQVRAGMVVVFGLALLCG